MSVQKKEVEESIIKEQENAIPGMLVCFSVFVSNEVASSTFGFDILCVHKS